MSQFLTPLRKDRLTAGERRFTQLLETHLDDDYLVWFNAASPGNIRRYPDFLIFHPAYGLWCIEIKDWHMKNINGLNSENVRLLQDGAITTVRNPLLQARESCFPFLNQMQKDKYLRQANGKHQGKLAFPWTYGAVMSNWRRASINSAHRDKLENAFPSNRTWYKEDIMEEALSREAFITKLHGMMPYRFGSTLSDSQVAHVRAHIFPDFIVSGQDNLFKDEESFQDVVKIMDNTQEKLARSLGDGHRVIHGVAGSGKTLILQHRAQKLAQEAPQNSIILIVCYNVLLASVLRSRLSQENIHIMHFHDWCGQIKTEYDLHVPYGTDYPKQLTDSVCRAIENGTVPSGQYYAVLIDEGHDFEASWLKALTVMPDPAHEHLLLLYDDAQTLYPGRRGIDFTLSSVGIKARGRSHILHTNYRNSYEIHQYAHRFIHHFLLDSLIEEDNIFSPFSEEKESTPELHKNSDNIPIVASESGGGRTDIEPEYRHSNSFNEEIRNIINKINTWMTEGIPLGDIAVLYYSKRQGEQLANALHPVFQLQNPVSKDERKNYRLNKEKLTLCTMHSSKGAEFPRVIVAGINTLPDNNEEKQEQSARLLYVAMTRAYSHLFLSAAGDNLFTRILQEMPSA